MWNLGERLALVKPQDKPVVQQLQDSLAVASLALEIARSDAAMQSKPMPEGLSELHRDVRQRYLDAALETLMRLNRTAELYAELQAQIVAWDRFAQFCADHDLDWCVDHSINADDALECFVEQTATATVKRFRDTLSGVFPGLQRHLDAQARLLEVGK